MAWFEDLSPCGYFGPEAGRVLRAIGWLEVGRRFPTGPTGRGIYDKLCELGKEPWTLVAFAGPHFCDLCQYNGPAGTANIFIPGSGFLYVCPQLITHYMNAHHYQPPDEFCEFVRRCPTMRKREYLQAMLGNGGRELKALWSKR